MLEALADLVEERREKNQSDMKRSKVVKRWVNTKTDSRYPKKHFGFIDLNEFNAAVQKKIDVKDHTNYPAFPETIILTCDDVFASLDCRYFNGKKIIKKRLNKTLNDSCPNFRKNK